MTTISPGDVEILLDGSPVILSCSLGAAKMISAVTNGFVGVYNDVNQFKFTAYPLVVAAGTGKSIQEVEDAVFATGMDSLRAPLIRYLSRLSNAGRDPHRFSPDEDDRIKVAATTFVESLAAIGASPVSVAEAIMQASDVARNFIATTPAAPVDQDAPQGN